MIRGLLRVAIVGAAVAWLADRYLASRRGSGRPPALEMLVVIDAPVERVWSVVSDIPRQPEWMLEMKEVRMQTPEPTRVGSRGEATVRILGISVSDPVTVSEFEPPHRFAVAHEGVFTGGGVITLEAMAGDLATVVRWRETLIPPVLPDLVARIQAPVLREVFQGDLLRLKALVEAGPRAGARAGAETAPRSAAEA